MKYDIIANSIVKHYKEKIVDVKPFIKSKMEKLKNFISKIIRNKYVKQRLIGVILLLLSVLICTTDLMYDADLGTRDATITLLLIPFGLWMIFSDDLMIG